MPSTTRAGRAVRLSRNSERRLIVLLGLGLTLSLVWAGAASYCLVFHDEMLARFVSQQSARHHAYEDRLRTLQSALDRTQAERPLLRDSLDSRIAALTERQSLIEKRQGLLSALTGSADPVEAPLNPDPPSTAVPDEPMPELRMGGKDRADAATVRRLARLEQALDRMSTTQFRVVAEIGQRAERSARRFRELIAGTGLAPARFDPPVAAVGGPFVPLGSDAFERALAETRHRVEDETQLRRITAGLPFRQPVTGDLAFTSGFGARLDPFTRGYALHTGLDLRAQPGAPVRATAAGKVIAAGDAGGYGNMVEIDHGRGLVTRYAHLSGFAVTAGQRVAAGSIVGFAGSTGRSTGSHLHYETRIDGEPVDPQRFLRAGSQLVFAE